LIQTGGREEEERERDESLGKARKRRIRRRRKEPLLSNTEPSWEKCWTSSGIRNRWEGGGREILVGRKGE
jgi:hypothetical protein